MESTSSESHSLNSTPRDGDWLNSPFYSNFAPAIDKDKVHPPIIVPSQWAKVAAGYDAGVSKSNHGSSTSHVPGPSPVHRILAEANHFLSC